MDGISRISDRILEDARAEADRIIEDAKERARSLIDERMKQAEKESKGIIKESKARAEERRQRLLAMAGLEMRKEILLVKQEIIASIMEKVKETIMTMPKDEYRGMISSMLLDSAQGNEEVFFSSVDQERLDTGLIDEVNHLLKGRGKEGGLRLSPTRGDFTGGFILKSQGMEINNTFDSILRMGRDKMESSLAGILFREDG